MIRRWLLGRETRLWAIAVGIWSGGLTALANGDVAVAAWAGGLGLICLVVNADLGRRADR